MKRESRQHGMFRSYRILPPPLNPRLDTRLVNRLDIPSTVVLLTRASSKPAIPSKFTGKRGTPRCSRCHPHPASRSKDKTKGTQKLKSNDAVLKAEWVTGCRFSAKGMLDHLENDYLEYESMEDEDEVDYHVNHSYSFADLFHRYDHDAYRLVIM